MPELIGSSGPATRPLRASACPGLFRIAPARDGGICRIKLPFGRLASTQARAIAEAAGRFGNGLIEITNRANVQLRGVAESAGAGLIETLLAAGLGPNRPDADDVRNVMVSPIAGIDPEQYLDVLPLARDLLAHIESDAGCRSLSPKFSFLIDGGEGVAALDRPHDVWLAGMGGGRMALGFGGLPPIRADDETPFAVVAVERAVNAVAAAVRLFLDAAADDPTAVRFRDLFAQMPRERLLDQLCEQPGTGLVRDDGRPRWRRVEPCKASPVGIHAQRQDGFRFVGVAPPLARLSPAMLEGLASVADAMGEGILRLTPWHGVIVPFVPVKQCLDSLRTLHRVGFVTDPDDPLASMVACSGATGCHAGLSDTKSDALFLAESLGRAPGSIHLSGCVKGCAAAGPTDTTLIAVGPNRYDVFVKGKGRDTTGLGRCLAQNLDIGKIASRLRERAP